MQKRIVYGNNPLRWPRAFLLEMMMNWGIFAHILAWSILASWFKPVIDLLINIVR